MCLFIYIWKGYTYWICKLFFFNEKEIKLLFSWYKTLNILNYESKLVWFDFFLSCHKTVQIIFVFNITRKAPKSYTKTSIFSDHFPVWICWILKSHHGDIPLAKSAYLKLILFFIGWECMRMFNAEIRDNAGW